MGGERGIFHWARTSSLGSDFRGRSRMPGGAGGKGAFDLVYDVDLVWPFGSEGDVIRFAQQEGWK